MKELAHPAAPTITSGAVRGLSGRFAPAGDAPRGWPLLGGERDERGVLALQRHFLAGCLPRDPPL